MRSQLALATLFFGLTSCVDTEQTNTQNINANKSVVQTYWVNSFKTKCVTVAPTECLQVKKQQQADIGDWITFSSTIDGFDFKPGYIYKLLVSEETRPESRLPADASSIKYTLIEVLDKQFYPIFVLNDIWALSYIEGAETSLESHKNRPLLEIHIAKMEVIGNDGCNNFMGNLKLIETNRIEFGHLATTRKMCVDMGLSDQFNKHMNNVRTYQIKDLKLKLFDANQQLLLEFKKVD